MTRPTSEFVWFFDCDGVLLDSNAVKTEAFRSVTLPYGAEVAEAVVRHHVAHGGMSRFAKFNRLFTDVLLRQPTAGEVDSLLEQFAAHCRAGLSTCDVDPAAVALLDCIAASGAPAFVVSGGAEDEVRLALELHGLAHLFAGIHGSPATKFEIIESIRSDAGPQATAVYVGDSELDMEVAAEFDLHAVFVTHWTEFDGWREYVETRPEILVVDDLTMLVRHLTDQRRTGPDWLRSLP